MFLFASYSHFLLYLCQTNIRKFSFMLFGFLLIFLSFFFFYCLNDAIFFFEFKSFAVCSDRNTTGFFFAWISNGGCVCCIWCDTCFLGGWGVFISCICWWLSVLVCFFSWFSFLHEIWDGNYSFWNFFFLFGSFERLLGNLLWKNFSLIIECVTLFIC